MKRALWLMCWLGLGCSAAEPGGAAVGGATSVVGGAAGSVAAAGASSSGGSIASGGASGSATTSAGQTTGGASSLAGNGGSAAGTPGAGGGGGSGNGGTNSAGGSAGTASVGGAGASGSSGCVPDASGALSTVGDTVHDAKTCLDWMKTTKTGVNYAAADLFCGDATTGGFDDWRIPTASEFASTITLCGKYPPDGPTDTKFFDQQGDGYWTSTSAGEPNKVCAIGMLDAGDYYHYGTAGPQVVRCVRGTGSVKLIKDCTMATGCKTW